jgi:hypothetical protein
MKEEVINACAYVVYGGNKRSSLAEVMEES